MSRKKKRTQVPGGKSWHIRIRDERRPFDDTSINLLKEAAIEFSIQMNKEKAEEVLAKAKRSKAKNKDEKIAAAQTKIDELETMRKNMLGGKTGK